MQPSHPSPPDHELERSLSELWPVSKWLRTRVLVAVSGGADSVACLRAMLRLAGTPTRIDVAHFNHGWRGEESEGDEAFVSKLCEALGVRLFTGRAADIQGGEIEKSEAGAREARYRFLTDVAYKSGARYVVTAHTASDRVETLLHNLFRGTGLSGVCSPTRYRPLHDDLVLERPLLGCTREQVVDYLQSLGQTFREDSSNHDASFRRNFLRRNLLPLVREQYGPHVDQRLLSFSEIAEEAHSVFQQLATDYLNDVERLARQAHADGMFGRVDQAQFAFPTAVGLARPWPVIHEALYRVWIDRGWPLQKMAREHWDEIRRVYERGSAASPHDDDPMTQHTEARAAKRSSRWHGAAECNLPGSLQLLTGDTWIVIRKIG